MPCLNTQKTNIQIYQLRGLREVWYSLRRETQKRPPPISRASSRKTSASRCLNGGLGIARHSAEAVGLGFAITCPSVAVELAVERAGGVHHGARLGREPCSTTRSLRVATLNGLAARSTIQPFRKIAVFVRRADLRGDVAVCAWPPPHFLQQKRMRVMPSGGTFS